MYLTIAAKRALQTLGEQIRLARKRRQWTVAELAEKMGVTSPTLLNLEKGKPVSTAVLFSALWILGLEREILFLTQPYDKLGFELMDRRMPKKVKLARKNLKNDF